MKLCKTFCTKNWITPCLVLVNATNKYILKPKPIVFYDSYDCLQSASGRDTRVLFYSNCECVIIYVIYEKHGELIFVSKSFCFWTLNFASLIYKWNLTLHIIEFLN
jgi:hypothetical protein